MPEIALAALMISLFAWLRADNTATRKELRAEISSLTQEMGGLRERMARMEGLLEGLREAIVGKQAA